MTSSEFILVGLSIIPIIAPLVKGDNFVVIATEVMGRTVTSYRIATEMEKGLHSIMWDPFWVYQRDFPLHQKDPSTPDR